MSTAKEAVESLFISYRKLSPNSIEKLPQSGGDRVYFRIRSGDESFIGTANQNLRENESFFYFTEQFKKLSAPVPEIFAISEDRTCYLQQDMGTNSLLDELEKNGETPAVLSLFRQTVSELARLQILADKDFDYSKCITSRVFGRRAILSDLLYFKYYFLDGLKIAYDKELLVDEFDVLSSFLESGDHKYFMYRDFQSRNVIVNGDKVAFIDYQGGMKGALQYDVASLLWQAKANLSDAWKIDLLDHYMDEVARVVAVPIDRSAFTEQYHGFVLIRLLQVLGAYGFRGLFERKAHFLTSIPLALKNLAHFMANHSTGTPLPELERVIALICSPEVADRFQPVKATADTPLIVRIKSFSFLKTGYPAVVADNGGGFVFDCRGILNPGRLEEHKQQTGRDKPVQDFLTDKTRMDEFLAGVYSVVDISVEDYITRNFSDLEINFGCTGGQHRSVYAADALARHLRNKYRVKTEVKHLEQNFSE